MASITRILLLLMAAALTAGCGEQASPPNSAPVVVAPVAEAAAATQPEKACCLPAATQAAPVAGAAPEVKGVRASEWVAPEKRSDYNLDYHFTNQDGQILKLGDLTGVPLAVTFIFTQCTNPNMCPLNAAMMADLQKKVDRAGLGEKVRLLLISYDPANDTPDKLKKFGEAHGLHFDNAMLLRPAADDFRGLLGELQVRVSFTPEGEIVHTTELLLIDSKGRFVRDYQGGMWKSEAVLEDLKKLSEEKG